MYHICISYAVQDILRYIQLRAIQIRRCNNNLHIVVYEARLLYPDVNLNAVNINHFSYLYLFNAPQRRREQVRYSAYCCRQRTYFDVC